MTYDFPTRYINDLSDIPEEHAEVTQMMRLSNRTNELSHQPHGRQAVFVYRFDGELSARLTDRIKNIDVYLQATNDNYQYDRREIEMVYILPEQS